MRPEPAAATSPDPVGYWALLRHNAPYRRLWAGFVVSMAGDWFRTIALYHLVLQLTGTSGLALSGVVLAQTLALFALSPVAGVVADRYSRKAIMISADLLRAVLALGFLAISSADRLWLAYVLTAALMGVSAFFNPAHVATIPNITAPRELLAANALTSASWAAMLALGAALGGVVAAAFGAGAAFVINAAAYVVSALCISTVSVPRAAQPAAGPSQHTQNGWQAFWQGVRYMAGKPHVRRLLTVKAWSAGVAGGGLLVLFALFAEGIFQAGALGMGTLYMTRGLGAMLGPVLARHWLGEDPSRMLRAISVAFGCAAACYVAFAYMPSLWLAACALCLATMASNVLWVFSATLLQQSVPDAYRGRVFATDFALFTIVMSLSTLLTGWSLDQLWTTPRTAAAILGALLLLPALFWLPTTLRPDTALPAPDAPHR
ncbi:MAG: MFS transporter [Candidatus Tectimicrobiota bacterium]